MAITQEFREAVDKKDTRMIKIMLKDSLVVDPTFIEFNQMIAVAENKIRNLYDEHDGEKLNYDMSSWTKDYMDEQMVQLVYNFSKERLDLLKKICKYLYKDRIAKIQNSGNSKNYKHKITRKQVGGALAVGGVVTTAAGVVIAKPLIIGVGISAVVVGGVIILTDK